MKHYCQLLFSLFGLILFLLSACQSEQHPVVRNEFLFGTYFSLTVYDSDADRTHVEETIDSTIARTRRLEQQLNPYHSQSLISRLNAASADQHSQNLPKNVNDLVQSAINLSQQSQGAFDFTLWPVFRLWHFDTDSTTVPTTDDIKQALINVDYSKVSLENNILTLPPGTEVDFGAISKGFAVEMIRQSLKESGLQNFIIDMGGNLGIEWQNDQPIEVMIRHPRHDGEFYGNLTVNRSCGIATSGDYHFYFESDGKRYHHILDPETGYPAKNIVSTTIVAPNAILADGLSTAIFVMGKDKGMDFINTQKGVEGLILQQKAPDELIHSISSGLANIFSLLAVP